jgi:hypothetical protein
MAYGTVKVDFISYTEGGSDRTISVSGLADGSVISGDITSTGTISADVGIFNSLPGYAVLSGAQTFFSGQRGNVSVVSYSTGIQLDFNTSNNFQITLTGNTTLQNPSNTVSGQGGIVTIIQGSGNNTAAFESNWHYPGGSGSVPSLTTASGAVDVLVYYVVNASSVAFRLVSDVKA